MERIYHLARGGHEHGPFKTVNLRNWGSRKTLKQERKEHEHVIGEVAIQAKFADWFGRSHKNNHIAAKK